MPGDGWGGALATAIGTALSAAGHTRRDPGTVLTKAGEFEVRGAGAEPVDPPEGGTHADYTAGVGLYRETAEVRMCVSSESGGTQSLFPVAASCVAAAQSGGWRDPEVEFLEAAYGDKSEGRRLAVVSGVAISGYVQGLPS